MNPLRQTPFINTDINTNINIIIDNTNNLSINNSRPTDSTTNLKNTENTNTTNIENRKITPTKICYRDPNTSKTIRELHLTSEEFLDLFPHNSKGIFDDIDHVVILDDLSINSSHLSDGLDYSIQKIKFQQKITVKGNLTMAPGRNVDITFPKVLNVEESFTMNYFSEKIKFPEVLNVGHTFKCINSLITELPKNLIAKRIEIVNCDDLFAIHNGVKATDSLSIRDCPNIETLPKKIFLRELEITGAYNPKKLPKDLAVETLCLEYSAITDIPKRIKKELKIFGSHEQIKFPANFKVQDLTLEFCSKPINTQNITVTNNLSVRFCDYIQSKEDLPNSSYTRGQIIIQEGSAE